MPSTITKTQAKKLALTDLERSDLRAKDAKLMALEFYSEEQSAESFNSNEGIAAYVIPYFDIDGNELDDFYRVRFLGELTPKGFGKKQKKPQRYTQPANTPPRLYFPPQVTSWKAIASNPANNLIIVEGEKKAACLASHGLNAIAVGGVWNFSAKKYGKDVIDDFDLFDWQGREVMTMYDSDMCINPDVIKANNALATKLLERGARVKIARLPMDSDLGPKIGADDFVKEYGIKALQTHVIDTAELFKGAEALWEMNKNVCFIKNLTTIYRIDTGQMLNDAKFKNMAYSNETFNIIEADAIKVKKTPEEWLKWKHRREHEGIVYEPGQPTVTDKNEYNIWTGWGCEPKEPTDENHLKIFFEFYDKIICHGLKPAEKDYLTKWIAYPLQNPGAKLFSFVLLWSSVQGLGKTFLAEIIGRIYGPRNFTLITNSQLNSSFNSQLAEKQFIVGEEIHVTSKLLESELKHMTSGSVIHINKKFAPEYTIRNTVNFMFTSNRPDAMHIERFDRRAFVHEITANKRAGSFYKRLERWMKGDGPSYLFWYMLNEVDLSKFDAKSAPPITEAKEAMTQTTGSDLDNFAYMLMDDPDYTLKIDGIESKRDLFTLNELKHFLPEDIRARNPTSTAFGKSLRRMGFPELRQISTHSGRKRVIATRNLKKWRNADTRDWARHYNDASTLKEDKKGRVTRPKGSKM